MNQCKSYMIQHKSLKKSRASHHVNSEEIKRERSFKSTGTACALRPVAAFLI